MSYPFGVGVIAQTPWAAFDGKEALNVTWSRTGKAQGYDSERSFDTHLAVARGTMTAPVEIGEKVGDALSAFDTAAAIFEREYRCDYAYHAQMEPLNAVASVSPAGDAAEIWCGTQAQPVAVEATANALGIPKSKVILHDMLMGGGFGRRGNRDQEFVIDAVLLSKEAKRPVKLMWTREDDVHNGRFRPQSAHVLRAGIDSAGRPIAWHHRYATDNTRPFRTRPTTTGHGGRRTSSRCEVPTFPLIRSRIGSPNTCRSTPASGSWRCAG